MNVPSPPTSGGAAAWVSWILLVLGIGAAYGVFLLIGGRVKKPSSEGESGTRLDVPTRSGEPTASIDTNGMAPSLLRSMDAITASLSGAFDEINALKTEQASINARFAAEQEFTAALGEHIDHMIAGHAEGIFPPWPVKPTRQPIP